ncbi:unnamed protein product [Lampetra fluviatilis]
MRRALDGAVSSRPLQAPVTRGETAPVSTGPEAAVRSADFEHLGSGGGGTQRSSRAFTAPATSRPAPRGGTAILKLKRRRRRRRPVIKRLA